jgi:hypothetical protein
MAQHYVKHQLITNYNIKDCGNATLGGSSQATDPTTCNTPCSGNKTEVCGGGNRLSLFWSGITPAPPSYNKGPPGWTHQGCYSEGTNGRRILPMGVNVAGGATNMSVRSCTDACAGYTYAGVEYGDECCTFPVF